MEPKKMNLSYKKDAAKVVQLAQGKIPPQAEDMERAILGGLLIDKRALDDVVDMLSVEVFYNPKHQEIYKAIDTLFKNGEPIDLLTVSNQLTTFGTLQAAGGDAYLIALTQKVVSSANIQTHAKIVLQKYIQRSLILISHKIINESYKDSTDVFDLLDLAESKLFDISQNTFKKSTQSSENLVAEALQRIQDLSKKQGISGLASGFADIDAVTSGWQTSDLIIVAARPGMGKTAFTLSMVSNMAIKNNQPVAFFSLEMSALQLITRLIASETGLYSEKLRTGKLENYEWDILTAKGDAIAKAPIFIDDTPSLSIFDLRAKARRLKSQHDIKMLIVDYLQLMTCGTQTKPGNREQEIATISRNLKALAKELDIPVMALAQLSRNTETRGGSKRPILSDLRESGAIEQDADIVSFLYRPEYYGLTEWDDEENIPCEGQAEFIMGKHRNGALKNIRLKFVANLAKFKNLTDGQNTEIHSAMNQVQPTSAEEAFDKANANQDSDIPF